jgi:putative sterol carrier protein
MNIEEIRQKLADKVVGIDPIGHTLKFHLDDDVMLVDGTGDANIISGEDREADCTITMSKETYLKLQRKEIKPFFATITGKIKVKGNIAVAQKLKQLT